MDMMEVDPKLFVTCRLCLEDTGLYQIIPTVQQQIKYCFDIEVEPFDGLPQLICKKCKTILMEYYSTKKIFVEKQQTLKTKLEVEKERPTCSKDQQVIVISSQQSISEESNVKKPFKNKKRKKIRLISSDTSVDLDTDKSSATTFSNETNPNIEKLHVSWKKQYNKQFVCRFCQKSFRKKSYISRHVRIHDKVLFRYFNILKTCSVRLNRIDNQHNITGSTKTVVYSQDKIISDDGNISYQVIYTPKQINHNHNNIKNSNRTSALNDKSAIKNLIKRSSSDYSDNDICQKRKSSKRCRLLSKSSNDTVVIEGNSTRSPILTDNEKESKIKIDPACKEAVIEDHVECIDIDDTSTDSTSIKINTDLKSNSESKQSVKVTDYKTLQNIISVCHSKYSKRFQSNDDIQNNKSTKCQMDSESQIKDKILSIGRKVINRQGFSCTGLLRFMERKNLEIIWFPTVHLNTTRETNFVRIMTKLKGADECYNNNNSGWENFPEIVQENEPFEDYSSTVNMLSSSLTMGQIKENRSYKVISTDPGIFCDSPISMDADGVVTNKLLNINPVANPKQLPKKAYNVIKTSDEQIIKSTNDNNSICIDLDYEEPSRTYMPVITSTTSLAPNISNTTQGDSIDINEKSDHIKSSNNSEKPAPRIKVKPVSELMSERALNNLSQQQISVPDNIWTVDHSPVPYQNTINRCMLNERPTFQNINNEFQSVPCQNRSPKPASQSPAGASSALNQEFVILDTTELPNTKTGSPFLYFKNLLQIHGIVLLDSNEILPPDFISIIKFKLMFRQENTDQTMGLSLCLSLFCSKNKFCLKIKDIDINKIPAYWQWEVLKAFKGEVVNKLLQNAQKISQVVYEFTKRFICLLKSINLKSIT